MDHIVSNKSLEYCLSNLVGIDIDEIREDEIDGISANNTQLLLNSIWKNLPREMTNDGLMVILPMKQIIQFPRVYALPEMREKTKWEKFAEMKGIKKRKRSKMVYDPVTDDFVPRWGKNSIKKIHRKHNRAIIEIKNNIDSYEDPREKISREKEVAKIKQKLREVKNKKQTKRDESKLPLGVISLRGSNQKRTKDEIAWLYDRVAISTASYGRRDKALPNEVNKVRNTGNKKRLINIKTESQVYKDIINKLC